MYDFPQATHAFSAKLILTNNISLYHTFQNKMEVSIIFVALQSY